MSRFEVYDVKLQRINIEIMLKTSNKKKTNNQKSVVSGVWELSREKVAKNASHYVKNNK